jgi:allantoinase
MPLNSIPSTVDMAALSEKRRFANGSIWVDVGLWGGIVPGCAPHIRPLVEEGGVRGFKCFLCPSGVDEFPMCRDEDLHAGFRELVGLRARSVFLFHAEKEVAEASSAGGGDPRAYRTFLQSRPPSMEEAGIATVISFCRQYNYPCHIVHLSSAECLPMIREAKREGLPLTVETCHHYLTLSADQIPDGKTEYKCCPPIRDDGNRELLWKALLDGTIDMVVSDHSPSVDSLKCRHSGDFMAAWGGISSVQFGLSILLTNAMERGIALDRLAQWVCVNTAKLAGLDHKKGRIAVGYDADFALIDDSKTFSITQSVVQHKNKTSPYVGKTLRGLVKSTFLRGTLVYDAELDMMVPAAPTGKILDDVFLKAAKI